MQGTNPYRCRWNFVQAPPNITSQSGENANFESFGTNSYRYVVREYIQNSIDAAVDKSFKSPIVVRMNFRTFPTSDFESLVGNDLLQHIKACKETCDKNSNGVNPYVNPLNYLESIQNKTFDCLEISDEGTKGMPYDKNDKYCGFNAGVRKTGASHKDGLGSAGGSHGLGKTVGFVVSACSAVYYSTMTTSHSTFGEGVVSLCDHDIDQDTYCASAFFDSKNGIFPDEGDEIPEVFRREKPGTSVFIIGATYDEDSISVMKEEVLRSFWMAMHDGKLVVEIEGEFFSRDNIIQKMDEYFKPEKYDEYDIKALSNQVLMADFNPKPYYKNCILDQELNDDFHKVFISSEELYPKLGRATLYIYLNENIKTRTDDRIVCMRDMGMVIEFKRNRSRKGLYGVLVCDGEGTGVLRMIENVTHEKWDWQPIKKKLSPQDLADAQEVLKEIDRFVNAVRDELFPSTDDTIYSVPVLSKYLLAPGNKPSEDNGTATDSESDGAGQPQAPNSTKADGYTTRRVIGKNLGRVVLRRKGGAKKKKNKTPIDGGFGGGTVPAPPLREKEHNEPPTPTPTPTPTPKPNNPYVPPTGDDNKMMPRQNGPVGFHEPTKQGNHTNKVAAQFRVVPHLDDSGLIHRIIINSDADYTSCSMVVNIAGEDSDSVLSFTPLNPEYKVGGRDGNVISNFSLTSGKNYIDIKFSDNEFHSLSIKAYED